jgi:uncharacterized protein YjiS (DUF1127 family)
MLTATIMAEIAGRQRPIEYSLNIEQYQRSRRYLHAREWRGWLKHAAAGLRRGLYSGASYTWGVLRFALSAIAQERKRSAYRRALKALNTSTLKDIGLHRSEIPWALNGLSTTAKLSRLSAWSVRD